MTWFEIFPNNKMSTQQIVFIAIILAVMNLKIRYELFNKHLYIYVLDNLNYKKFFRTSLSLLRFKSFL